MAAKSGGFDKGEIKRIKENMAQEITMIERCVDNYNTYISDIENGTNSDGTKGLWSGKLAVAWVKAAKGDCIRLAQILKELNRCQNALEQLWYDNKNR